MLGVMAVALVKAGPVSPTTLAPAPLPTPNQLGLLDSA